MNRERQLLGSINPEEFLEFMRLAAESIERPWMTIEEASRRAGISRSVLCRLIKLGLPTFQYERTVRINKHDFDQWLRDHAIAKLPKEAETACDG